VREICFLTASGGNAFMKELLHAVGDAVAQEGVAVRFEDDRYPPFEDDVAYVVIPHEFFELAPEGGSPTPGHLQRTVGYCVELPWTHWFWIAMHYGKQLGGLVDIRASGVRAQRQMGLHAVHAPLGYTPAWDRWGRDETAARPLDILYMGSHELRRDRVLAGFAETLARRTSRLLVASERAKPRAGPSFVLDEEKYALLASAKTVLNLHRAKADALEWPRVLEAISNGCVVVTERSLDIEPLVPDEHLVTGRAESLCLLADHLLDDPDRLARMRLAAYDFVRSELPIAPGARVLAEVAHSVASRRIGGGAPPLRRIAADRGDEKLDEALAPLRVALKRLLVDVQESRREVAELREGRADGARGPRVRAVAHTPAYADFTPRVTVGISVHNYEVEVRDALASVAASEYDDYEVLVLDDASTDASGAAVRAFLEQHPWMPGVLMEHSRNAGLARTRNAIAQRARGELLFVLDADNGLHPHGLGRLVEALDGDPDAQFAYGIIAVHEQGSPAGLLSRQDWDPALLLHDNPIDAMALIRRDALLELGGYCEDPRLVGWEDYDVWCQMAERGWYGVHVPEILAWYRRTAHSMLSLTSLDLSEGRSLIASRAPGVFSSGPAPDR
jgi:hypothetical protein